MESNVEPGNPEGPKQIIRRIAHVAYAGAAAESAPEEVVRLEPSEAMQRFHNRPA